MVWAWSVNSYPAFSKKALIILPKRGANYLQPVCTGMSNCKRRKWHHYLRVEVKYVGWVALCIFTVGKTICCIFCGSLWLTCLIDKTCDWSCCRPSEHLVFFRTVVLGTFAGSIAICSTIVCHYLWKNIATQAYCLAPLKPGYSKKAFIFKIAETSEKPSDFNGHVWKYLQCFLLQEYECCEMLWSLQQWIYSKLAVPNLIYFLFIIFSIKLALEICVVTQMVYWMFLCWFSHKAFCASMKKQSINMSLVTWHWTIGCLTFENCSWHEKKEQLGWYYNGN